MLGALLGACLALPAGAQTLDYLSWERGDTVFEPDAAAATAFYFDASASTGHQRWQYSAGYVTERDAQSNPHKRLVIYKFDADTTSGSNEPPADAVFFPPSGTPAGQHAATDLIVDSDGNLYVCGYTTIGTSGSETNTNVNYVVIKYDKNLATVWSGLNAGTHDEAQIYDGPDGGEDKAVSIARSVGSGDIFVTGTSHDDENGDDVVTLYLNSSGGYSDEWLASGGEAQGVRRYDDPSVHGDDTAAEVGYYEVDDVDGYWGVLVVGTTDKGATAKMDVLLLNYGDEGSLSSGGGWVSNFNGTASGNDHGTGIATLLTGSHIDGLYICGYSDAEAAPVDEIDYMTLRVSTSTGADMWTKYQPWGYEGYAADIAAWSYDGNPDYVHVWVTGRARVGSADVCGTVVYLDEDNDASVIGQDQYQYSSGLEARGEALLVSEQGIFVAGRAKSGVTDHDALVIKYAVSGDPTSLTRTWVARAPGGTETEFDAAVCIAGDGVDDVFCGGVATQSSYGEDFMSMAVNE